MGKNWFDGEKLDITNPETVAGISTSPTITIECRCGDQIGYGLIQFDFYGNHPKYAP